MRRRILTYPVYMDELKTKSEPVKEVDTSIKLLVDDLWDTLKDSEIGIGLAAPQIGEHKRVFVMYSQENGPIAFINPEIIETQGRRRYKEGCLSFPGQFVWVRRKQKVKVKYICPENGEQIYEANELDAICIQHEIDHLDGKLLGGK